MRRLRPVILVGHCWPDAQLLRNAIARAVPGAMVTLANEDHVLRDCIDGDCVLLINRELEGDYPFRYGVDLIKELARREHPPAMMLISNYPDAQEHAMAAGAMRGFGKAQIHHEHTAELLRAATLTAHSSSMPEA